MSKIVQPFGEVASEIIIKADTKGMVVVEGWTYTVAMKRGFRPERVRIPLDSRQMVLALQKVSLDYCVQLFGLIPDGKTEKPNGQESNQDGNTSA